MSLFFFFLSGFRQGLLSYDTTASFSVFGHFFFFFFFFPTQFLLSWRGKRGQIAQGVRKGPFWGLVEGNIQAGLI